MVKQRLILPRQAFLQQISTRKIMLRTKPKARLGAGHVLEGKTSSCSEQEQQGVVASASTPALAPDEQQLLERDDPRSSSSSWPHMLPKVMVPFETKPGAVPRQIEIQRKRRMYACQSIPDLLAAQHGLQRLQQLTPQQQQQPEAQPDWASLAVFDDAGYETREPEEWCPPQVPGLPRAQGKVGSADAAGSLRWLDCTVLQHSTAGSGNLSDINAPTRYLVQLLQLQPAPECPFPPADDGGSSNSSSCSGNTAAAAGSNSADAAAAGAAQAAGVSLQEQPFWVPRVQLCFGAEDPAVYARRVAAAASALQQAQQALLAELCVDCMPVDDVPQLTTEQVNRVLNYALNSKKLKHKLMDSSTSALISEANLQHARAINKVTMRTLQAAAATAAAAAAGDAGSAVAAPPGFAAGLVGQLLPAAMQPLQQPVGRAVDAAGGGLRQPAAGSGSRGTVAMPPGYKFAEQQSEFAFRTLLAKPEVIFALGKIRVESGKVLKLCLFNTFSCKSVRLEEFEQVQVAAMDAVANHLRDNWSASIKNTIKTSFESVGKGWYNLAETSFDTGYKFSKLRRFLGLVRFSMEETLRQLAEHSMARFVAFMQDCCNSNAAAACGGPAAHRVAGSDGKEQQPTGRRAPLLLTELVLVQPSATSSGSTTISATASGNAAASASSVAFSTPIDSMHAKVIAVFDKAISKLQGLPQLEPAIMDQLFWPNTPLLSAVHLQEEMAVRARAALTTCVTEALAPMHSFLAQFRAVAEPLLALNVDAYLESLAAPGLAQLALPDIRREVQRHSAELAALQEQLLPPTANLGLVLVNCTKVREVLLSKKEKLVAGLKAVAAKVPRSLSAATSARFAELERSVKARPGSIEDIDAQRRFLGDLTARMAPLVAEVEAAKAWYAALDGMRYLLPEDDAREQLVAQGWPARLLRQADRELEVLEADQARLAEEMRGQQDAFAATISILAALVAAMPARADLSAAAAISAEASVLQQQLQEAQAQAGRFNTREGLLGWGATDYGQLQELVSALEPFGQFWGAVATFKASHAQWMVQEAAQLQGAAVDQLVAATHETLTHTKQVFEKLELPQLAANAGEVLCEVEGFQQLLPLVKALSSPGMQPRHWQRLSSELGQAIEPPGPGYSLDSALQAGLLQHVDALTAAATVATEEFAIQQALEQLQHDWEAESLAVVPHPGTDAHAVQVDGSLLQRLEQGISALQGMAASPHEAPFEQQLSQLSEALALVHQVLQQWLPLQETWLALLPAFSATGVPAAASLLARQLPQEAKRFGTVDRWMRKTVDTLKRNSGLVLKVWCDQKLADQLAESRKLLEAVQQSVADHQADG